MGNNWRYRSLKLWQCNSRYENAATGKVNKVAGNKQLSHHLRDYKNFGRSTKQNKKNCIWKLKKSRTSDVTVITYKLDYRFGKHV